jgi:hypothetical protein
MQLSGHYHSNYVSIFVTLLLFCDVTNPIKLFDEHASQMSEDITHRLNQRPSQSNTSSMDSYVRSSLLIELDKLLRDSGYCLSHFSLPLPDDIGNVSAQNRLLLDELSYNIHDMTSTLNDNISMLNKD